MSLDNTARGHLEIRKLEPCRNFNSDENFVMGLRLNVQKRFVMPVLYGKYTIIPYKSGY